MIKHKSYQGILDAYCITQQELAAILEINRGMLSMALTKKRTPTTRVIKLNEDIFQFANRYSPPKQAIGIYDEKFREELIAQREGCKIDLEEFQNQLNAFRSQRDALQKSVTLLSTIPADFFHESENPSEILRLIALFLACNERKLAKFTAEKELKLARKVAAFQGELNYLDSLITTPEVQS